MATTVDIQEITDEPADVDFGPDYNNIEATVFVPEGDDSIWVGGPNVDTEDHGVEWLPGSEHLVKLFSGGKLYAVTETGITVEIKILNTGN